MHVCRLFELNATVSFISDTGSEGCKSVLKLFLLWIRSHLLGVRGEFAGSPVLNTAHTPANLFKAPRSHLTFKSGCLSWKCVLIPIRPDQTRTFKIHWRLTETVTRLFLIHGACVNNRRGSERDAVIDSWELWLTAQCFSFFKARVDSGMRAGDR